MSRRRPRSTMPAAHPPKRAAVPAPPPRPRPPGPPAPRKVARIIDDVSGKMLEMKTPCIVLEGADASGEFLHFCPQQERIFWREGWLAPDRSSSTRTRRSYRSGDRR